MSLHKNNKGQSTAEYAIAIGLVIAVAAGVLQVALKKGITQKQAQALNILSLAGQSAGSSGADTFLGNETAGALGLYQQDWRQTQVSANEQESVLQKGGSEKRYQTQTSSTSAVSIETLDSVK